MSREPAGPGEQVRSVLVAVDLTATTDRVLGRVARLPLAADADVTLVHVVPAGFSRREQSAAARDARRRLKDEARHLARTLPGSVTLDVVVAEGAAASRISACAAERTVELIVMGRGGERALRDIFLGSTAERVVRRSQLPVLVVRLPPRADYRRPAVALDLDDAAARTIGWVLRVLPRPPPTLEVLHACDSIYDGSIYPSLSQPSVEERRAEVRQSASVALASRVAASLGQAGGPAAEVQWRMYVRYGSARAVIRRAVQQRSVDVLALGTRGRAGLAHAFLGSVAGDLLREVPCDVLVVPPRAEDADVTDGGR